MKKSPLSQGVVIPKKKKKDFKLCENIVAEFERLAPSGKQTTIVEQLLAQWVAEQYRTQQEAEIRKAYQRTKRG